MVIAVEPSVLIEVISRDAGDLRELRLQRLGHRGGHGVGTGAGKLRRNLNGRKIDLRQRRDRQSRIGDDADEQNADHQQRGCDRMPNERRGDTACHGQGALAGAFCAAVCLRRRRELVALRSARPTSLAAIDIGRPTTTFSPGDRPLRDDAIARRPPG